ncbi:mannitol dehydrogenase family protein [uncultured Tateyamaria sp.]|uniref:mannitol dehydrogenase family protein n=1 Tax=Tateyamaria sp. 1078 TaxID=3417464 RepID=UPI002626467C|nr:mannitol dehydrogenase family protein [uncultured Tateyamaria sp.]
MGHILHLGVGNFFRAHQAWYTQHCPGWDITGVSFRSTSIRDGLAAQGYHYSLVIKDAGGARIERITCLHDMIVAADAPEAVLAQIAADTTQVITLTVTEKAYRLGPDGVLDMDDPAICADLSGGEMTVIGALARGLARRSAPVTVLSCDNLPDNGTKLGAAVRRFADAAGLRIGTRVTFPSCMVDRITPATSDAIRTEAGDAMAVPTEAFSEWVIEDDFAAARPDWPGVQWVSDVAPHEMRKLRMLNGAHSYLAYAGTLAGQSFVHEAIGDPALRDGAAGVMAEAAETLPPEVQEQAPRYAQALLERFDNPNLHHRLRQIAMDGSQKMPIRICATLADRDAHSPALEAALSAWVAFVRAEIAAGRVLDDPRSDALADACASGDPDAALRTLVMPG